MLLNTECNDWLIYCILPVNSHDYCKFQVEIGLATNRGFNTEIVYKAQIYGFQTCIARRLSEM